MTNQTSTEAYKKFDLNNYEDAKAALRYALRYAAMRYTYRPHDDPETQDLAMTTLAAAVAMGEPIGKACLCEIMHTRYLAQERTGTGIGTGTGARVNGVEQGAMKPLRAWYEAETQAQGRTLSSAEVDAKIAEICAERVAAQKARDPKGSGGHTVRPEVLRAELLRADDRVVSLDAVDYERPGDCATLAGRLADARAASDLEDAEARADIVLARRRGDEDLAREMRANYMAAHPEWLEERYDTVDEAIPTKSRYAPRYLAVGTVGRDGYLPVERPKKVWKPSPQMRASAYFDQVAAFYRVVPVQRATVHPKAMEAARDAVIEEFARRDIPAAKASPVLWLARHWSLDRETDPDFADVYRGLFLPFGGDALTAEQRAGVARAFVALADRLAVEGIDPAATTDIWLGCTTTAATWKRIPLTR